jgi:hypothetical protein
MFTRMIRRRLPPLTGLSSTRIGVTHVSPLRRCITSGNSLHGHQTCGLRQRAFSTTLTRYAPTHEYLESSADPTRPDLFYHFTSLPNASNTPVYALSFLPALPVTLAPDSPAVIGWLPASAEAEGEAGLNDFKENRAYSFRTASHWLMKTVAQFRDALHKAVQTCLENESDEILKNAAISTGEGWMHINGKLYQGLVSVYMLRVWTQTNETHLL